MTCLLPGINLVTSSMKQRSIHAWTIQTNKQRDSETVAPTPQKKSCHQSCAVINQWTPITHYAFVEGMMGKKGSFVDMQVDFIPQPQTWGYQFLQEETLATLETSVSIKSQGRGQQRNPNEQVPTVDSFKIIRCCYKWPVCPWFGSFRIFQIMMESEDW